MNLSAALAATIALGSVAHAAMEQRCEVPPSYLEPDAQLPRTSVAVKVEHKLDIVVLSGAPSQVGTGDGPRSYPSFLEAALRERLPNTQIRVQVRTAPRRTTFEVVPALPQLLAETKPTLVIWQSGTVEAYRGIDADAYGRRLKAGVTTLLDGGADVMLVNMQYSPRTDALIDAASYTEAMRQVSDAKDVPFFNRYRIMREWMENGAFDLSALHIGRKEYEDIHRCLGELMAEFIIRAGTLQRNASR
jgi:hypothetical protein